MEISKIDHIGIAVKSITNSSLFWNKIMCLDFFGNEIISEQKVNTAIFFIGESKIELLESTSKDGPIAKYIKKKGEGIHHIAFKVKDINKIIDELKQKNVVLIDKKPRIGVGNSKIVFIHPKETNGVLVEICEHE